MKEIILTVHGINTDGKWQEAVKNVLEPHFECAAIQYPHYRYLGALKLLFEPYVLVPALAVPWIVSKWEHLKYPSMWVLGAFVLAYLGSYVRRHCALKYVLGQMNQSDFEDRRHLIAHSLGSYLTGKIILKHTWFRLSHVIYAGCVLSQKFNWRKLGLVNHPKPRCKHTVSSNETVNLSYPEELANAQAIKVRNDVQRKDLVPILAKALRAFLLPDFGMAGYSGFKDTLPCPPAVTVMHKVPTPSQACADCCANSHLAPLHNVVVDEYWHSGVFSDPRYISAFWLPFFWNIESSEYALFVQIFIESEKARRENFYSQIIEQERVFREQEWRWAGCKLTEFIKGEIEAYMKLYPHKDRNLTDDLVDFAVKGTWLRFDAAREAYRDRSVGWETTVLGLNPKHAVATAVKELMKLS